MAVSILNSNVASLCENVFYGGYSVMTAPYTSSINVSTDLVMSHLGYLDVYQVYLYCCLLDVSKFTDLISFVIYEFDE